MRAEEELKLVTSAKAGEGEARGKLVLTVIAKINKLARTHTLKQDNVTSEELSQHSCLKLMMPA